jgi:hypothetical protein
VCGKDTKLNAIHADCSVNSGPSPALLITMYTLFNMPEINAYREVESLYMSYF